MIDANNAFRLTDITKIQIGGVIGFLTRGRFNLCVINVYSFLYETNIQNRKYLYFKLVLAAYFSKKRLFAKKNILNF